MEQSNNRRTVPPIHFPEPYLGYLVTCISDVGPSREENQDFMGYVRLPDRQMVVVADGMGGHSGGFEASRVAVDAAQEVFGNSGSTLHPKEVLSMAIAQANSAVKQVGATNPEMQGMGTTIVMAIITGNEAWIAHVGDSRCYLIRDSRATLVTLDHSRVNRMVAAGMIPIDAADSHAMGHILERCIAGADDLVPEIRPEPVMLAKGDKLMLCSDGLWGVVSDQQIGVLFGKNPLRDAVAKAIDLAIANLTDDNTTVAALELSDGPKAAKLPIDARVQLRSISDQQQKLNAQASKLPSVTEKPNHRMPLQRSVTPTWVLVVLALGMFLFGISAGLGSGYLIWHQDDPNIQKDSHNNVKQDPPKTTNTDPVTKDADKKDESTTLKEADGPDDNDKRTSEDEQTDKGTNPQAKPTNKNSNKSTSNKSKKEQK
ncbi:MAG TPA: hypothetical protein EYN66_21335 [Myxococcales bacterium]|nr:hypothetical protein [Myxococcales bacterium]